LRFFPQDEQALNEALEMTTHSSKSNVIRSALAFYEQAWAGHCGGFRVVYRKEGTDERPDVLDAAVTQSSRAVARAQQPDQRPRTEKSIEIRVTPADSERIDALLAMGAADTYSEVIRRAIRLYAGVVSHGKDGWDVLSVSPSGDVLSLPVPGLGGPPQRSAPGAAADRPLPAANAARGPVASLDALLPQSLVGMVSTLAAREDCPVDALLADMIRAEATRRLGALEGGAPPPEAEAPGAPEADVPSPEDETPRAVEAAEDPALDALGELLDRMAQDMELVMQLMGGPDRAGSDQGQLSDLIFAAASETGEATEDGDASSAGPASRGEMLLARAEELSEKLTALLAVCQYQGKPKRSRAKRKKKDEGGAEQTLLDGPPDAPAEGSMEAPGTPG